MKAYLFHTENGIYEGETFEDGARLQHENGLTITPPPDYEPGQVPVFDRQRNSWEIIPVSIARQLLKLDKVNIPEQQK